MWRPQMISTNSRGKMKNIYLITGLLMLFLLDGIVLHGVQESVRLPSGCLEIRSENGAWGGAIAQGLVCMTGPAGQDVSRKIIDLTAIGEAEIQKAVGASLRCVIRIMDSDRGDGLNSEFAIAINGHKLVFSTDDKRFDGWKRQPGTEFLTDIPFPVTWLLPGKRNTIDIFKKSGDDLLYPCVDTSVPTLYSSVSKDGGASFHTDWQNTGNTGEIICRLLLKYDVEKRCAAWVRPGMLNDLGHLIGYAEAERQTRRFELRPGYYNASEDLKLSVTFNGTPGKVRLLDKTGAVIAVEAQVSGNMLEYELPAGNPLFAIEAEDTAIEELEILYYPPREYPAQPADASPVFQKSPFSRWNVEAICRVTNGRAILQNSALRAEFSVSPHFTLERLYVAEAGRNILVNPLETHLLKLEANGRMLSLRDAQVSSVNNTTAGLTVSFIWKNAGIGGTMIVSCEDDELEFALNLRNESSEEAALKTVFPHISGLCISESGEKDYYLYPYSGGMIDHAPLNWRDIYGENRVHHQFMDLFSPSKGAGLYLRVVDERGMFKVFSMRKGLNPTFSHVHPIYPWGGVIDISRIVNNPLDRTECTGMSVDYQQRNCERGSQCSYPPVRFGSHAGSWRNAFRRYAEWAKSVWPPRPFPSRLTTCWNLRAGYGLARPLLGNREYDEKYIGIRDRDGKSPGECIELIGWWTVGDTAPWSVPFGEESILGEKFWKIPLWVDPATGKMVYSYHLGDYDGYNPQWGGLPALREHIRKVREAGQVPIFYTTPFGISHGTRAAARWIPKQAVINPNFVNPQPTPKDPKEPVGIVLNYMKYVACIDNEEYIDYMAETMRRVCEETGIDGIRLDELGGPGYLCLSMAHKHLYAEYGNTEQLAASAELASRVHKAMDSVRKGLVLLAEFPGTGRLLAQLDGTLTYDCQNDIGLAVRPAPINLTREFFPECKQFEIDTSEKSASRWQYWFWNANGTYNSCYTEKVRQLLSQNADAFALGRMTTLEEGFPYGALVNRFEGKGGRRIRNILNVLDVSQRISIPARAGWRYMELLSGKVLDVKDERVEVTVRPHFVVSVAETEK